MSRPRFLADHDLAEAIIVGVMRREPAIQFHRLREVGLADRSDSQVLEYATKEGLLLVSHDVNTMTSHAFQRLNANVSTNGVFLAHQADPIGVTIDDLILIWAASEAEESVDQVTFLPMR